MEPASNLQTFHQSPTDALAQVVPGVYMC